MYSGNSQGQIIGISAASSLSGDVCFLRALGRCLFRLVSFSSCAVCKLVRKTKRGCGYNKVQLLNPPSSLAKEGGIHRQLERLLVFIYGGVCLVVKI